MSLKREHFARVLKFQFDAENVYELKVHGFL